MKQIALIGLGAMGSYLAPRLYQTFGDNFTVIADGDRAERLRNRGITVNGEVLHFPVTAPKDGTSVDLVIMAVKHTGLKQAILDIKQFVGDETQILCVMNGVESEETVAAVYGWEHVLYSFMRVSVVMEDYCANYDPSIGTIHFGEKNNKEYSNRVKAVAEVFERAGIHYSIDEDMIYALWFKYMANIGENMTCALLQVPFGAYRTSEHANFIRRQAMTEVVAIANHLGIALGEKEMAYQDKVVVGIPIQNKPSTLQDIEHKRKTEVEMFSGKICELGKQYHIATPVNEILYHGIKAVEEKYL